jgi:phospholipase/lecithinase/hemolysin
MIGSWNTQLNISAQKFSSTHSGSNSMVFDAYGLLTEVLNNSSSYNITNTTSFCPSYNAWDISTNYSSYGCLPIYDYFWYNSGHITYHIHEILATALAQFLEDQSVGEKPHGGKTWGCRWFGGQTF